MKSGNLHFLEPSGPLQACNGTALPFLLLFSWWDRTVSLRDCSCNQPTVLLSDYRQIWSICGMIPTDINRSTWSKPCPVASLSTTTATCTAWWSNPALRDERPATDPLKMERNVQELCSHSRRAVYVSRSTSLSEKLPALTGFLMFPFVRKGWKWHRPMLTVEW